jgi:hypothetical protein
MTRSVFLPIQDSNLPYQEYQSLPLAVAIIPVATTLAGKYSEFDTDGKNTVLYLASTIAISE